MYWTGKRYMLFQIAIYSQNLQFSFHAAVAYSESFQTCEMELFAGKINGFPLLTGLAKSSISDVLQGSKYTSFQLTININNIYGRDEPQQNIMASQISVFNAWWTLETTSTTESNDLLTKLSLPPHPTYSFIKSLVLFHFNNLIHVFL